MCESEGGTSETCEAADHSGTSSQTLTGEGFSEMMSSDGNKQFSCATVFPSFFRVCHVNIEKFYRTGHVVM